tara:strand:- start:581 stop:1075 length:495 start_codon:yes stop_codon:yes gene_type:complete
MTSDPIRRRRSGEAAFLLLLLVATAVLYGVTYTFRNVPWDSLGLAFWPRALLIGLAICSVWRLSAVLFFASEITDANGRERRGELVQGLIAWIICVAYLPLLLMFGFAIASMVYLVGFGLAIAGRLDVRTSVTGLIVAALIVAVIMVLFEYVLGTELPAGMLFG